MRRALAILTALAACGDNIRGIEIDELDASRHAAECERLVRCDLFSDEETCVAFFRPSVDPNLRTQVDRGLVRFDPLAAAACNRAVAEIGCSVTERDVRVTPDVCNRVLVGTVHTDGTCVADRECGSRHCSAPICSRSACCAGGCDAYVGPAQLGEDCVGDIGCVDGAFCGKELTCLPLGGPSRPCEADSQCAYGLGCVGATEFQPGACRVLPLLGEPCPYLRCAQIGARCSPDQVCVPAGTTGAGCTSDAECSQYYECDLATHRCAALPQLGQHCGSRCAGASSCDASGERVCIAPQPNAAPCTADNQCATQYCEEGPIFDQCASAAICF